MDWLWTAFDWGMDHIMPVIIALVILAIAALVVWGLAWCVCEATATRWHEVGTVVGKSYSPDTQETNTVPVATGNGVGVGVVTTGHEREWITLIRVGGEVYEFNNVTVYIDAKVGSSIGVNMKRNAVSGVDISSVEVNP